MTLRVAASGLVRRALVARPRPLLVPQPGGRAVTILARWQSSTSSSSSSSSDAARQMMHVFGQRAPTRRREVLDGIQLQKLSLTLGRRRLGGGGGGVDVSRDPPPAGTPVPPGYHLVYFTPAFVEADLGPDGTDKSFNAPAPFTRRMWAGGSMSWHPTEPLRVGQLVEERTSLLSAESKVSRDGSEMVLVEVLKEFWLPGVHAPVLVDKRNWIFRPEVPPPTHDDDAAAAPPALDPVVPGPSTCVDVDTGRTCEPLRNWSAMGGQAAGDDQGPPTYPERRVRWSPVGLFRFSALTFNGHRIHYDGGWARRVERHAAPVVHAPLNLLGMLDYWRDTACADENTAAGPARIEYRARAPLYAGDEYSIQAVAADGGYGESTTTTTRWDVAVQRGAALCMTGTIHGSVEGAPGHGDGD